MNALYGEDLYIWLREQATLLRQGKVSETDASHIADEIQKVGVNLSNELTKAIGGLILQLMRWRYLPDQQNEVWYRGMVAWRQKIRRLLTRSPSLEEFILDAILDGYDAARAKVIGESEGDLSSTIPEDCPWSFGSVMKVGTEP